MPKNYTFLPFASFAPGGTDHAGVESGSLARAENAIPLFTGYAPLPGISQTATLAAGPVTGAYAHFFPSGGGTSSYVGDQVTIHLGTKTNLYTTTGSAFTSRSRGGGYAAGVGDEPAGWRFASFGNDIWACNGLDILQRRTNNAGNFADGPASTFVPEPRFVATVREFLVVADLSANAGRFADEFAWSDVDDPTWFDASNATRPTSLAGAKRIVSRPGQITGLTGGEHGKIYKRNSTHSLLFTAGSDTWRLDEMSHGVGCVLPSSLIASQRGDFFLGSDGFYRCTGLSAPEKISTPEVDQWVLDAYNNAPFAFNYDAPTTMAAEDALIRGWECRRSGLIFWTYINRTLAVTNRHRLGVCHSPELGLWAMLNRSDLEVACAASMPYRTTTSNLRPLNDVALFQWDGTNTFYAEFSGTAGATSFRSKKFALQTGKRPARVTGVCPIFTIPDNYDDGSVLYFSPDVACKVTGSIEPLFRDIQDADSTVVSPRFEQYDTSDFPDTGMHWYPHIVDGNHFRVQVDVPAETALVGSPQIRSAYTNFGGCIIEWEAL